MTPTSAGTQTSIRLVLDLTLTGRENQSDDEVRNDFMSAFAPGGLATIGGGMLDDFALDAQGQRAWREHLSHGGGDAESCEHEECTMREHLPIGGYPGPFIIAATASRH